MAKARSIPYAGCPRFWEQTTVLVLLLLGLGCPPARGQDRSDWIGWGAAGVRVWPDSGRWAADVTYQYMAYQNVSRTYLHFGTAYVTYFFPKHGLALSSGYLTGPVDQEGRVHIAQLRLQQSLSKWTLRPHWQLSFDRWWLTPRVYEGETRPLVHRVRWLVGIGPPLAKRLDLILNTEPFLYRTPTWFQEVRTQAGLRWQPNRSLTAQLVYWNRWRGYEPVRVTWEHAVLLTAVVLID